MTEQSAVVVGGASGIGKAVAHALAANGHRVIVADRNADGAYGNRRDAFATGSRHADSCLEIPNAGRIERRKLAIAMPEHQIWLNVSLGQRRQRQSVGQ